MRFWNRLRQPEFVRTYQSPVSGRLPGLVSVSQVPQEQCNIREGNDQAGSSHQHENERRDRKSTRLNSSHVRISYAVFCLKKKKKKKKDKLQNKSIRIH